MLLPKAFCLNNYTEQHIRQKWAWPFLGILPHIPCCSWGKITHWQVHTSYRSQITVPWPAREDKIKTKHQTTSLAVVKFAYQVLMLCLVLTNVITSILQTVLITSRHKNNYTVTSRDLWKIHSLWYLVLKCQLEVRAVACRPTIGWEQALQTTNIQLFDNQLLLPEPSLCQQVSMQLIQPIVLLPKAILYVCVYVLIV